MIRKPEDLPEDAADKHFAEECCRYEQTPVNLGSAWRCQNSASVNLSGDDTPECWVSLCRDAAVAFNARADGDGFLSVQPVTP